VKLIEKGKAQINVKIQSNQKGWFTSKIIVIWLCHNFIITILLFCALNKWIFSCFKIVKCNFDEDLSRVY